MITIKCKCGSSEMTFQNLSEKDFPDGWVTDCCLEKAKKESAKQPEVPEDVVEAQLEAVEELGAAVGPEDEPAPAEEVEEEQPKRRGRKPKA